MEKDCDRKPRSSKEGDNSPTFLRQLNCRLYANKRHSGRGCECLKVTHTCRQPWRLDRLLSGQRRHRLGRTERARITSVSNALHCAFSLPWLRFNIGHYKLNGNNAMALGHVGPKRVKRCSVCGQTKKLWSNEKMCGECRSLPLEERNAKRAKRKPKGSVYAVSGGLPSLGRRR